MCIVDSGVTLIRAFVIRSVVVEDVPPESDGDGVDDLEWGREFARRAVLEEATRRAARASGGGTRRGGDPRVARGPRRSSGYDGREPQADVGRAHRHRPGPRGSRASWKALSMGKTLARSYTIAAQQ